MNHSGRGDAEVAPLRAHRPPLTGGRRVRPVRPAILNEGPALHDTRSPVQTAALKYARDLERWLDHMEAALAGACACPCPWCPDCIESLSELVPDGKVEEAGRIRDGE